MIEQAENPTAYRGVRALVLGSSGFIGRWVARSLEQAGAITFLAVRTRPTATEIFSQYSINGNVIEFDLLQPGSVRDAILDINPSIIFNLAGYGIDRTERDDATAYLINEGTVETICEAIGRLPATDWPGRRLVHTGSALEYGTAEGDLNELTVPAPTTLYGRSKLAGTKVLATSCGLKKIQSVTARLFTVYGPGEHPGRLLPALIETASTRKPIALTEGLQLRDFTYVEDVAEGLLRLGRTNGSPGEVINLATGRLASVRSFIEAAAEIVGLPRALLGFGALPTRPEEMNHDPVAIDRLRGLTKWSPKTNIHDGIRSTLEFLTDQETRQFPEIIDADLSGRSRP